MYDEAVERVKKFANTMKVGDPKKEGEHIGPVVSEVQYKKIQSLIQKGIDEGAKLVAGGVGKPDGIDKGYFVKPTAFADVNNKMEIARTEIFGPVLSIIPFENEEEAIYCFFLVFERYNCCLLYTSPSPRDLSTSRMPSSA